MPRIGIVAGEASGDVLGGDLISALRDRNPHIRFAGIGGEHMKHAGCECLYPVEKLSVMGLTEVFGRFFELLGIRSALKKIFLDDPPDLFVGIDAPDFNFPLERALRRTGIKTVHYVSPSIWAWREYRMKSIAKSVDLMLTLFPFEPPFYDKYGIPVRFAGHPLANKIALDTDRFSMRKELDLPDDKKIVAILPGSRAAELEKLAVPFLQTAALCHKQRPDLLFISNLVSDDDRKYIETLAGNVAADIDIRCFSGRSLTVMGAADVVLLASGTAALEAMLLKRPMVVGYQVNWLTWQLAKRLVRTPYVSLPNILARKQLVPECLQHDCCPENLGREILYWLENEKQVAALEREFTQIHTAIRSIPGHSAADIIGDLLGETR